jgi:hypothetical protein
MTYTISYQEKKDAPRRWITSIDPYYKASEDEKKALPLTYKQKEIVRSVLQNSNCKSIQIHELQETIL